MDPKDFGERVSDLIGMRSDGDEEFIDAVDAAELREKAGDGTEGTVVKPFDHSEAGYRDKNHPQFDPSHERCASCAHYDGDGNCFIVPNIEPDEYCEEFYADYGAFGHEHPGVVELNLALIGSEFDWDGDDIDSFVDAIRDDLSSRVE